MGIGDGHERRLPLLTTGDAETWAIIRQSLFISVSALDKPTRRRLVRELGDLPRARRLATVFVTHDLAETSALCDGYAVIDAGTILQHGPPRELFLRPRTPRVAEILGLETS